MVGDECQPPLKMADIMMCGKFAFLLFLHTLCLENVFFYIPMRKSISCDLIGISLWHLCKVNEPVLFE